MPGLQSRKTGLPTRCPAAIPLSGNPSIEDREHFSMLAGRDQRHESARRTARESGAEETLVRTRIWVQTGMLIVYGTNTEGLMDCAGHHRGHRRLCQRPETNCAPGDRVKRSFTLSSGTRSRCNGVSIRKYLASQGLVDQCELGSVQRLAFIPDSSLPAKECGARRNTPD